MLGTRSAVAAAAANARGLTAVAGAERGPRKAASESRNSRASSPSACLDGEAADKSALRPGAAMTAISASADPTTAAVRPKNLFKTGLLPLKCLLLTRDPCRAYLTLYPAVLPVTAAGPPTSSSSSHALGGDRERIEGRSA